MKTIDLRSDTVTRPTVEMRRAMTNAEVGDDVYKDDPTVNRLEALACEITGQPAALFFPTGTQSNLCALLSHCQRGEEYICGQKAHIYAYEAGGGAVLGSIQPQPVEHEPDGSLDLNKIRKVIKADNFHYAISRLLCLENTFHGKVLSLHYMHQAIAAAREHHLAVHLDGARVFNAATALGCDVKEITTLFDSVSVCLSKGLCAPAGTMLCGHSDLIKRAKRWRKMVGGGMRQTGILAAAGIIALETMSKRLGDDHEHGAEFARRISLHTSLGVEHHTNMVFLALDARQTDLLKAAFEQTGIKVSFSANTRFVFHNDITAEDMIKAADTVIRALG